MPSVRLCYILIAWLTAAGLAGPAGGQDDVFVDRFEAGIQRAMVDGGASWWRRGSNIEVWLPCDTVSEVQVVASPGGDWVFDFGPLPTGISETGNGLLEVEPACGGTVLEVDVSASSASLPGFSDVAGILFGEQPRIAEFFDLGASSSTPNSGGVIGPIEVACNETLEGTLLATPADRDWTFAYDNVASGISTTPEGLLTVNYSCADAPASLSLVAQASDDLLSTNPTQVYFSVTAPDPGGLEILGLDYDLDGNVNNQFVPGDDRIENEVPYFCSTLGRNTRIISNDPDTTYTIVSGENAVIDDTNRLRFGALPDSAGCNTHPVIDSDGNVETPGGLENVVVIEATSPLGTKTFSVDTRAYSPMITHVYVEPGQTSGGSERDPYVVQFDENKFSEMMNLSYDRIPGQPHNLTLVPAISHYDVDLMRPERSYNFDHNNQPSWMSLDAFLGVIDASPTASNPGDGFVLPRPSYTINVGSTEGPELYRLNITVNDD